MIPVSPGFERNFPSYMATIILNFFIVFSVAEIWLTGIYQSNRAETDMLQSDWLKIDIIDAFVWEVEFLKQDISSSHLVRGYIVNALDFP